MAYRCCAPRNVSRQERTPKTETLHKEKMQASPWLASHLGVRVGAAVFHLQRRRCIDERPVLLEDIFLIARRYPGLLTADLDGSLSEVLAQRYGVRTQRSHIVFTSTALLGPHADALWVSSGTPGLLLTRTARDSDGQVVEFDQEYWRHDVLNIALTTRGNLGERPDPVVHQVVRDGLQVAENQADAT